MKLSKVDAAKLIGVSRQSLYTYINSGRISVDPEGTIDTAELLRAGFTLRQGERKDVVETGRDLTASTVQVDTFREMIELLRQQLAEAQERERAGREREALLLNMLQEAQKQSQRLLEMPRQTTQAPVSSRRPSDIPENWQRIMEYMRSSNRPVRPAEVQGALGLDRTPRHTMNRMVQAGLLRRVEQGLYEPSQPMKSEGD